VKCTNPNRLKPEARDHASARQAGAKVKKVLLIDDDELILVALQNALADEGISIQTTADGPHGLQLFEMEHPGLVLLDIGLPTMNGLEVLKRIREIDPDACVIILSGYAAPEIIQSAQELGARDFVEKTLPFSDLLEKIKLVVADRE
jgi:two-component system, response regulator, stage 0 sporulation protein F